MPGPLWNLWLAHVLREGPTWLHVALMLTHMLCLRITEVLRLRARDFNFKTQCVFIAPLKRGTAAWKHLLKPALAKLRLLKAHGVNRKRSRSKGMWGRVTFQDKWVFPREPDQLLFPALRADCNTKHINKDTACKAVSRLRATFSIPPKVSVAIVTQNIRTHSGRHRMVNDMKRCDVAEATAMQYARIVDRRLLSFQLVTITFCPASFRFSNMWGIFVCALIVKDLLGLRRPG